MDNMKFGQFIAQLRREKGLTQKELADLLYVTDKAVSKWETGKGFPDVKLLEPLSQALDISLVELINGERTQHHSLSLDEAETVVSRAVEQSEKITAKRYLKLLRWLLLSIAILFSVKPVTHLIFYLRFWALLNLPPSGSSEIGVIGGADGPTAIITASAPMFPWQFSLLLTGVVVAICLYFSFRVRKLEKKL